MRSPKLAAPDIAPSAERSATMRAVKSRDTGPELVVRKLLTRLAPGYRLCRDRSARQA